MKDISGPIGPDHGYSIGLVDYSHGAGMALCVSIYTCICEKRVFVSFV